ncbi:MAG: RsmB/NOP family class I SAM-dependent RNA methyltransferase [Pseudomonadota bacterium]
MTPAARQQAAIEVLDLWLSGQAAEQALTRWARSARYAGSKDRAAVRDIVFDCVRCKRSFAHAGGAMSGRGLVIGRLRARQEDAAQVFTGHTHAPSPLTDAEQSFRAGPAANAVSLDIPDWLETPLLTSLGSQAEPVLEAMRARAPVYVRVNLSISSRESVIADLAAENIVAVLISTCNSCLQVTENARKIVNSKVFQCGMIELQDLSSQLVCDALPVTKAARILDYCAGGGGKSLAMADRCRAMGHQVHLYAHDASPARMRDLPERARRAGVEIATLAQDHLKRHAPFDLVVCDVPCSGSGAWRRSPDGKWNLTREKLNSLYQTQENILKTAAELVSEAGVLAYVTCSYLRRENEDQIDAFIQQFPHWRVTASQRFSPLTQGDGFFYALLTRQHGDL